MDRSIPNQEKLPSPHQRRQATTYTTTIPTAPPTTLPPPSYDQVIAKDNTQQLRPPTNTQISSTITTFTDDGIITLTIPPFFTDIRVKTIVQFLYQHLHSFCHDIPTLHTCKDDCLYVFCNHYLNKFAPLNSAFLDSDVHELESYHQNYRHLQGTDETNATTDTVNLERLNIINSELVSSANHCIEELHLQLNFLKQQLYQYCPIFVVAGVTSLDDFDDDQQALLFRVIRALDVCFVSNHWTRYIDQNDIIMSLNHIKLFYQKRHHSYGRHNIECEYICDEQGTKKTVPLVLHHKIVHHIDHETHTDRYGYGFGLQLSPSYEAESFIFPPSHCLTLNVPIPAFFADPTNDTHVGSNVDNDHITRVNEWNDAPTTALKLNTTETMTKDNLVMMYLEPLNEDHISFIIAMLSSPLYNKHHCIAYLETNAPEQQEQGRHHGDHIHTDEETPVINDLFRQLTSLSVNSTHQPHKTQFLAESGDILDEEEKSDKLTQLGDVDVSACINAINKLNIDKQRKYTERDSVENVGNNDIMTADIDDGLHYKPSKNGGLRRDGQPDKRCKPDPNPNPNPSFL